MIKSKFRITIPLCGLLLLYSCRTEELLHEVGQKEELSKKFITFTKKHENDVIDYGEGFKSLALRYDSIHKTNMTGRADIAKLKEELQTNEKISFSKSNEVAYIDFNVRSQLMEEENGDKWMVFPRVKGKEVVDLVMAILSEEETLLNYYTINKESELYKENISKFEEVYQKKQQKSWNVKGSSYTTFSMVERGIDPVDMIGRRPIKPIFVGIIIPILPPNLGEDIGRCSAYEMCTDIGPEVGGGGGNSSNNDNKDKNKNPCDKAKEGAAKANELAKKNFLGAKDEILNAYKYGVGVDKKGQGMENGVAFGYNKDGVMTRTGVQHFGRSSGTIVSEFDYPTADMHNHPEDTPPSPGDMYKMMEAHLRNDTFRTRYVVLPDGTMYALVVTDTNAIREFSQKYPYTQLPGNGPNFPDKLLEEYNEISMKFSEAGALSYILSKYNAGISLTKMDSSGRFRNINITKNGDSDYKYELCP